MARDKARICVNTQLIKNNKNAIDFKSTGLKKQLQSQVTQLFKKTEGAETQL
jgi:hypothetical protein